LDKESEKREVEVLNTSSIGILLGKMREKAVELLEGMIDLPVYELVTHMEGVLLKDQQKLWIECKSGYLELMNLEKLEEM
jgi:hypothetical protein